MHIKQAPLNQRKLQQRALKHILAVQLRFIEQRAKGLSMGNKYKWSNYDVLKIAMLLFDLGV